MLHQPTQAQTAFFSTVRQTDTAQFATPTDALPSEERFYMEILGAQTEYPNFQNYQFTDESMQYMVEGYKTGLSLMVNHTSFGLNVGFGQSTDAMFDGRNLIIQAYIKRGQTTPQGPFGNTDELIAAVEDGFLKDASVQILIMEATKCSICGEDGPMSPFSLFFGATPDPKGCAHVRGEKYKVEEHGQTVEKTAIAFLYKVMPTELSLVWDAADYEAGVINRNLQLSNQYSELMLALMPEYQQLVQFNRTYHPIRSNPMNITPEQFQTLQAEKSALEAQVAAKDIEIASLKASQTALEVSITEKEKEIATLKAQKAENEQAITDGATAREKAITECVEAFNKTEPDTPAAELEAKATTERAQCETFSLEQIYKRTEGYVSFAKKLYPSGRGTNPDAAEPGSDTPPKRIRRGRRQ